MSSFFHQSSSFCFRANSKNRLQSHTPFKTAQAFNYKNVGIFPYSHRIRRVGDALTYLTIIIVFKTFFIRGTEKTELSSSLLLNLKRTSCRLSTTIYDVRRVIVYHSVGVENNNFWYLRDSTTPLPPDVYAIS